jgi:DNA-binding NtrC family response regulator
MIQREFQMTLSLSHRKQESQQILVCTSSARDGEGLSHLLPHEVFKSDLALSPLQAIEKLTLANFKAAIIMFQADETSWIESIPLMNSLFPHLPIVVVADSDSIETERLARRGKIFYYLLKPIDAAELKAVLLDAGEKSEY